ncbi:putative L-aspartate dehydrogenase [Portunus trituberculatus]|uniref:Putative L-aspartate dehydrogenase n=1 Tax=Portunus trituberculatus TaxID=210409 RepID=A0A5B7HK49_PORTR|nr:putative L-aspartate dehydrogenase [Portunus trituberculatus]
MLSFQFGPMFLEVADYLIGSPTALASQEVETSLRVGATTQGLYIPTGAFWGTEDIIKMADEGSLKVQGALRKQQCHHLV